MQRTLLVAMFAFLVPAAQAQRTARFSAGDMQVTVQYADRVPAAIHAELRRTLRGALERYQALFGAPPRAGPALRLEVSSAEDGSGEADSGIIRLVVGRRPASGFHDWRLTLLHEAFHLWNAESFRSADGRELWFDEGASEYYALQTAVRLGLVPASSATVIADTVRARYLAASGLGRISLRDAGTTDELRREHHVLVHHGGWVAVRQLDRDIRSHSHEQKSLDDLMRALFRGFDADRHRYTMTDLIAQIDALTGDDFRPFFRRYIDGTDTLP